MKMDNYETKDITQIWNREYNGNYVRQSQQTGLHFYDKKRKYQVSGKVRLSSKIYVQQINLNKNYILFKMTKELWVYNFHNRQLVCKCQIPKIDQDK
ncbi:UNKNOWN [Stylonychia lemnae]|uniref:Uncharacterized protein n=1 Tax=Stylonychia lemnae TaxID=5949 RepID=A0A078AHD8_STYLE|nr:UNKNOWN [Stylonychia lemnae]|eukprot:CDW81705.1 UNKNOWN [Stylonychia lemnae]